jgi:hypothetical protein
MKIGMYMYDREIDLNDEATSLFLEQYDNAKEGMKALLDKFEEEDTRTVMFYMMSLRCFIDDFLEFCAEDISVEEMTLLLNTPSDYDIDFDEFDDDEGEVLVEFDDDEEA